MILVLMFLLIVSNILYLYISKRHTTNQAVRVYNEFIEGRRCNGGESILSYATPTREPEKRYATDYFMADSTGDGILELHLRTSREYVIFTYRECPLLTSIVLPNNLEEFDVSAFCPSEGRDVICIIEKVHKLRRQYWKWI